MLRSLSVHNYALIDELEVEFGAGLNVITGETGAGKSILLGALKLILGERASTEAVRTGAKKAVVEGVFDEATGEKLERVLAENEIDADQPGVVIVRREVSATHSRAFVNDTPATLGVLRAVAEELIDLHGQHEHQSLLRIESHVDLVDAFGGHAALRAAYRAAYDRVRDLRREQEDLRRREAELRQQRDLAAFQIEEIDRVGPEEGEDEALQQERRILENVERLLEATSSLLQILYEGDEAVFDRLATARNELRDLSRIDSAFDATAAELDQASVIVEEAAKFLQEYGSGVEFNPERLEAIRSRAARIDTLKRKYGGTLAAVLHHRREIGEVFELASGFDEAIAHLEQQIADAQTELATLADELSRARRTTASTIEGAIGDELRDLGMPHAVFGVAFSYDPSSDGWVTLDGRALKASPSGVDRVEFLVSANPGEPPRPLTRVASGGEISRIMLALKSILARSDRLPILVFDEIDVGVSGETARRVGESMRRLAASHQIIAITHLPQIAALADHHFLVEKHVADARSRTAIRRLEGEERARQVAALVAGEQVSEAALASARELIAAADR